MTSSDQFSSTALVAGASRGFGRAVASVLHAQGAKVVAVARNAQLLDSLNADLGGSLTTAVVISSAVAVDLVVSPEHTPGAYLLTAAGLSRLT
jgi:NADP-dependent 3-hydroxy acid dehydrogenase YdfG